MNGPGYSISRRTLLSAGLAGGSSIVLTGVSLNGDSAAATEQLSMGHTDLSALKSNFGFKGTAFHASDPGFEKAAFGDLWNKLQPKRHPQMVAQASDD